MSAAAADKGWESYPKRLLNYDPLREDGVSYDARLAKDNKRLFTDKGNIDVDVLDIFRDEFIADNKKPTTYQDTDAFEECLTSVSSTIATTWQLRSGAITNICKIVTTQ